MFAFLMFLLIDKQCYMITYRTLPNEICQILMYFCHKAHRLNFETSEIAVYTRTYTYRTIRL